MIPYPRELLLDANNYGVVKTQTIFGFTRLNRSDIVENNYNTKAFPWKLDVGGNIGRSFSGVESNNTSGSKKQKITPISKRSDEDEDTVESLETDTDHLGRKGRKKGFKKCIFKILKAQKRKKKGKKSWNMSKKMMPLILGLLAAKTLLIPIAFKALTLLSAKGLLMGFFATMMASVIGLKSMFHSRNYHSRKDDSNPHEGVVPVPYGHYYDDDYYKREDNVPDVPYVLMTSPNNMETNRLKKH